MLYDDGKVKAMKYYEYRVIAINAAGESDPSPSTGPIQARPMAEAPKYVLHFTCALYVIYSFLSLFVNVSVY